MKRHYRFAGLAVTACAFLMSLAVAPHPAWAQSSGLVRGQVIDVDQSTGEITIRHGPIKKLGMWFFAPRTRRCSSGSKPEIG
jgi:hypothetical protein